MGRRRRVSGRFVATVLFTDIVGSTELAARLGDRDWREVLTAHHTLVRTELKLFGGREIDTAGDGFFARFDTPGAAIRCAVAVVEGMWAEGIPVRAGLHTGEFEVIDRKVGGIAAHIGSRVASIAGPGEILVTSTVRDLAAGAGLHFEDRGRHPLKGVPDDWHIFAVKEGEASSGRKALVPIRSRDVDSGPSTHRLRAWIIAALVVALAAMVAAFLPALTQDREPERRPALVFEQHPNGLARIDPTSGEVSIAKGVSNAGQIAIQGAYVWVNAPSGLFKVGTADLAIVANLVQLRHGSEVTGGIGVGEGSVLGHREHRRYRIHSSAVALQDQPRHE